MIELRAGIGNRPESADQLKADLDRLATLAESESERWLRLKPGDPRGKDATPAEPATARLVGRWSALVGKDQAFAIQIESDGQFRLVHVKSGKSTVSTGKTIQSGRDLTLAGDDGTKLRCTVTPQTDDAFQLAINDAKGKPTVKLDFKKQK